MSATTTTYSIGEISKLTLERVDALAATLTGRMTTFEARATEELSSVRRDSQSSDRVLGERSPTAARMPEQFACALEVSAWLISSCQLSSRPTWLILGPITREDPLEPSRVSSGRPQCYELQNALKMS